MHVATRCALAALVLAVAGSGAGRRPEPRPFARRNAFASRPLAFELNCGQTDPRVRFLARGSGGTAFLLDAEAVLATPNGALRIRAVTSATSAAEGLDELRGKANYLLGKDPANWRTGVPTFGRVRSAAVWPGIDLVWHASRDGRLEYDFVVAPGADPSAIAVEFTGADEVTIDEHGDVVARAGGAEFRQEAPVVYEETDGVRRTVAGSYVMDGSDRVRFAVSGRDPARTLFIDPVVYASYLGGDGLEYARAMERDSDGNTYVVGRTSSPDFPVSGAFQTAYHGTGGFGYGDAFVAKFDPSGTTLLYSTYLGGSADEEALGVAVDSLHNVFVCGCSRSTEFPTTAGAFRTTLNGLSDMFVAKLAASGTSLVYATFLAGSSPGEAEQCNGIAIDAAGSAYVTGIVGSTMPTTPGAFSTSSSGGVADAWVGKLTPDGSALAYATFLSGGATDYGLGIAVDDANNAYVAGHTGSSDFPTRAAQQAAYGGGFSDTFVACVNPGGSDLVYSTYLGGSGRDQAYAIAVSASREVYVTGFTDSSDFPTASPFQAANGGGTFDAFVTKLTSAGAVAYSTYLGGGGLDDGVGIVVDGTGSAWLTGCTQSADFPLAGAPRNELGGPSDAFVTRLSPAGDALLYSTYLGGSGEDAGYALRLDASQTPFVVGHTQSADLVTTQGAAQTSYAGAGDAFLATPPAPPAITSFFLPKKVVAKVNATSAAKSTVTAAGIFDTGPDAPDFASAATLDVGGLHFDIPGLSAAGKGFAFTGQGVTFSLTPNPYGSSRAKFNLKFTGDFAGKVALNGPLDLHFKNAITDGGGTVTLGGGVFGLGKVKGALVQPNLFVVRARANLKGAGQDALSVIVGLATGGVTPPAASKVTIGFGAGLSAEIPALGFTRKGSTDTFTGNVSGITKVVVDHAREQIAITGKALTLGNFAQGGNPVLLTVGLGNDVRSVSVRMGRIGNTMKY